MTGRDGLNLATRRPPVEAILGRLAFVQFPHHHRCVNFHLLLAVAALATNPVVVTKSRVVLARDSSAVNGWQIDATKVHALVAAGIQTLAGTTNESDAWRSMFSTRDIVGIKIATLAAPSHATHHPVVDAIVAGLQTAGITNIIVWDRDPVKLRQAGYTHARAVIGDTGWDDGQVYESSLVGKLIWGDREFGKAEPLGTRSHLPRVLQQITKLINVPVLMDHDACGLAGCLYNISLGAVDNYRRFEQFGQTGNPFIAEIAAMPALRSKLTLNITDALIAGYAGGPSFKPQYAWPHAGIYFSRDPVAQDVVCLEAIQAKRKEAHIPDGEAGHITTAGKLGLGQSDRAAIELIEVKP